MAPVLQCPDCNTKHPLATVPDAGTFPCRGCGRALKVPDLSRPTSRATAPATPRPAPAPAPGGAAAAHQHTVAAPVAEIPRRETTRAMPIIEQNAPPAAARSGRSVAPRPAAATSGSVPVALRILLWIVAIPVAFFLVFGVARALGYFTSENLSDLFLANSTSRFWPLARLLPFVALTAAGIVHGGVFGIMRLRGRKRAPTASI